MCSACVRSFDTAPRVVGVGQVAETIEAARLYTHERLPQWTQQSPSGARTVRLTCDRAFMQSVTLQTCRRWALLVLPLLVCFGCDSGERDRLRAENKELRSALKAALGEANEHIETAAEENSGLKLYAEDECESLTFAVQLIDEPETVDEP
jgi:hypothetical protein